jgi:hypothetical protein
MQSAGTAWHGAVEAAGILVGKGAEWARLAASSAAIIITTL